MRNNVFQLFGTLSYGWRTTCEGFFYQNALLQLFVLKLKINENAFALLCAENRLWVALADTMQFQGLKQQRGREEEFHSIEFRKVLMVVVCLRVDSACRFAFFFFVTFQRGCSANMFLAINNRLSIKQTKRRIN